MLTEYEITGLDSDGNNRPINIFQGPEGFIWVTVEGDDPDQDLPVDNKSEVALLDFILKKNHALVISNTAVRELEVLLEKMVILCIFNIKKMLLCNSRTMMRGVHHKQRLIFPILASV